jgi:hypothetical protein
MCLYGHGRWKTELRQRGELASHGTQTAGYGKHSTVFIPFLQLLFDFVRGSCPPLVIDELIDRNLAECR